MASPSQVAPPWIVLDRKSGTRTEAMDINCPGPYVSYFTPRRPTRQTLGASAQRTAPRASVRAIVVPGSGPDIPTCPHKLPRFLDSLFIPRRRAPTGAT